MNEELKMDLGQRSYLSARELIQKKSMLEKMKDRKMAFEVKGFGRLLFRVPTAMDIMDAQSFDGGAHEDDFLFYNTIVEPNLRNQELLEAYGCAAEPWSIVPKLFEGLPGAITTIVGKLVQAAGYDKNIVKVVDELKKG